MTCHRRRLPAPVRFFSPLRHGETSSRSTSTAAHRGISANTHSSQLPRGSSSSTRRKASERPSVRAPFLAFTSYDVLKCHCTVSGEGLFVEQASGVGVLILASLGAIVQRQLGPGEQWIGASIILFSCETRHFIPPQWTTDISSRGQRSTLLSEFRPAACSPVRRQTRDSCVGTCSFCSGGGAVLNMT